MNAEFKWTENTVAEFIQTRLHIQESASFDLIEQFKASKQPKQDWEILSVKDTQRGYLVTEVNKLPIYELSEYPEKYEKGRFEIHSVKRLSDDEVFSIGDKVVYMNNHNKYDIIIKIQLGNSQFGPKSPLAPYFVVENSSFGCYIDRINHYIPQIMFTTEDGIPLYKGDKFWHIDSNFEIKESIANAIWTGATRCFSTKEKAEEWLLWNKPVLTLNDIKKCNPYTTDYNPHYLKIIQIAKEKLNQK